MRRHVTKGPARARVCMAVFNSVAHDGRVRRAAEAVAETAEVFLLGLNSGVPCDLGPVRIRETRWPALGRCTPLRLLLFWLALLGYALRIRPDLVYVHDFFLLLPGWIVSRLLRASLVYDAHELILPTQGRYWSYSHRFFYAVERWLTRRADLVIAANARRAEMMRRHYELRELPTVVQNIAAYPPSPPTGGPAAGPFSAGGPIRLVYQGNMGLERKLATFLRILRHLDERFELLFIGDGPALPSLVQIAQQEGVSARVRFLGRLPAAELPAVLNRCAIGIVSYSSDTLNELYCAPNKVFEYAQAGIPIVATNQPSLRELVQENRIGVLVDHDDGRDEILRCSAARIRHLAENLAQFQQHIPAFLGQYNWPAEKQRLLASLHHLLPGEVTQVRPVNAGMTRTST